MQDADDFNQTKSSLTARGKAVLGILALSLFGAIIISVAIDENAGIDSVLVILFLGVISLFVPEVREAIRQATNIELPGGFKMTRGSGIDEAASAVEQLPVDEDEQAGEGDWRVIGADWADNHKAALRALRERLRERIAFVSKELYPGTDPEVDPVQTIKRLKEDDLLDVQEARSARTILLVSATTLKEGLRSERSAETVRRFMVAADRIAHIFRYIPIDKSIRRRLEEAGFVLIDYDQLRFAKTRWPDFYAVPKSASGKEWPVIRVSVRMAVMVDSSDLLRRTRDRLRKTRADNPETPLDRGAHPVIVVPDNSAVSADKSVGDDGVAVVVSK